MTVYILNIFSVFVWSGILALSKTKKRELILVLILSFQLVLLSTFRSNTVGSDTINYINRFFIISATDWKYIYDLRDVVDFEEGFIIFNKIIGTLSSNRTVFLAINSAIIVFSVADFIYKKSPNIFLSFLVFIGLGFWGDSMNILRQMLALAILLRSLKYIEEKQLFRFVFLVIVASTFHISALSFIIVYPLSLLKINRVYLITMITLGVSVYLLADKIIIYLLNFFGYQQHFSSIGTSSGGGMIVMLIMFAIAALYVRKVAIQKHDDFDLYIHLIFIGILLNILAIDFALAGRSMIYFTIHNIILIPKILDSISKDFDRYIGTFIIILGILYFYLFILLKVDGSGVVPYIFR